MIRSLKCILLALVVSVPFISRSQDSALWKTYFISKSIDTSNLNARKLFRDPKKASSLQYNIAEFYLYKNGALVKPSGKVRTDFFPAACLCFKFDDTLMLNMGLGLQAGVGVGLKIYGKKFCGSLHANAKNTFIFKLNRSDTAYTNDLVLEPESQSLRMVRAPTYASKEVIVGEYKATYRRFYEKRHKSKDSLVRYNVRIIFKSKVTGMDSLKEQLQASKR
jgi:hypothetical protein